MGTAARDPTRSDMVEYMRSAKEDGNWSRPHITDHHIHPDIAHAIRDGIKTEVVAVLCLGLEDSVIIIEDCPSTYSALHRRHDRDRQTMWRVPSYCEAALDVRYWLLQAALNDVPLRVDYLHDRVIDTILEVSPPEWNQDIKQLVEKYSR